VLWQQIIAHPNHDAFWQARAVPIRCVPCRAGAAGRRSRISRAITTHERRPALLHVAFRRAGPAPTPTSS
jgi:hypothetical protein